MRIYLDPEEARRRKEVHDWRLNACAIPRLRFLGLATLWGLTWFHYLLVPGSTTLRCVLVLGAALAFYGLLSLFVLRLAYRPGSKLPLVFLGADVVALLAPVAVTGGHRSLLFPILLARIADQTTAGFRRVLVWAHVVPASYLVLILLLPQGEGTPVIWGHEVAKAIFLYLISLYIAFTARTAERFRQRARLAIQTARELISRLQATTRELEEARSKAEEASAAKSRFLAHMSHDIRNPLNGILGTAQLLETTNLDEEQMEYVRTLQASGRSLLEVVNGILDLSRIESGRLELEETPLDLVPFLEETVRIFSAEAKRKGLALRLEVRPGVPERIRVDGGRLRQILTNLIANAIKFTDRGSVVVGLERWDGSGGGAEPQIHFWVRDTGLGIPADKLDSVFESYRQAHGGEKARRGSGLGLAICKALVEHMGGRIWVESHEGEGTTFHFLLPAKVEARPEAA
jgi:signal transduction histidine kinase